MNRIKAYTITITPSPKTRVNNMTNILSKNQNKARLCIPKLEIPFLIRKDLVQIADDNALKELWNNYFKFN